MMVMEVLSCAEGYGFIPPYSYSYLTVKVVRGHGKHL
jgi:hypothetical protein